MTETLVESIKLDNGLILNLFNCSKHAAADRWLVIFSARIDVEIKPELFTGAESGQYRFEEVRKALGDKITYIYDSERNFIDEKVKEEIWSSLKDAFLDSNLNYLSNQRFGVKFAIRKYTQTTTRGPVWRKF